MFSGVTNTFWNISQGKQQLNTSNKNVNLCKNTINTKYSLTTQIKTNGSFFLLKKQFSIDLFNLPPLLDARRQSTMQCKIPNDFFLPDGKNTQLSQIVNTWMFDRLTHNGNEGVGVQMDYLECAYETKYYVINKVNGKLMLSMMTVWNSPNLKVTLFLLI